ncbi:hypothetical protein WOLCODRAFT_93867 [Wolfiporia cocos MD-104 SS10]|uniref:Anaphase-promoting complex subunit 4 n=1 Tax=Wolfiporia cocos (strain MD-104) TaxID=742152 RepID=A0A2H3JAE3_WOLCO|nr:hypothetical protein WOLCODRAFT_93867 [Wolfiporia cocos MD-104 SS10]
MTSNSFASLASIPLPTFGRILPNSWCPDKDLVVVITRLGGKDRLSLWKMHGSKKWEVGFDHDGHSNRDVVVGVTWSPDGQTLAVAHEPPRITVHSIQDGHQEQTLPIVAPSSSFGTRKSPKLTAIWWFKHEKKEDQNSIPDIFKRGLDITGSAHSILRHQPLLDALQDESQTLTSTDLFGFDGTQARGATVTLPSVISSWPTLPSDPLAASIQPSQPSSQARPGEEHDVADDANIDSTLVTSDDSGNIYCFLDGQYPLGAIVTSRGVSMASLYKDDDLFFAHSQFSKPAKATAVRPILVQLPHLLHRHVRDVARTSSSVRDLVWYAMRVIKEMRGIWFGSDTHNGARELGPKWIRSLESRGAAFDNNSTNAMLDLTSLLTTGRLSDTLSDFLGSGEHMSERSLQKWEATMIEALIKLRDSAEKRVALACQRIHVLMEEMLGWASLPQYEFCGIDVSQVNSCLDLASRAIVIAAWLAATARKEMLRFAEFTSWIRYETLRANTPSDAHNQPIPRHDILEVNDYLMSGLVVSSIDKWFMGPVPGFLPHDLGVPERKQDLKAMMQKARGVLRDQQQMAWQSDVKQKDLSHLDRNLDSLIQELAARCQRIFADAAGATGRSASMLTPENLTQGRDKARTEHAEAYSPSMIRERTVPDSSRARTFTQYLAMHMPRVDDKSYLIVVRMHHGPHTAALPLDASVAVLECCVAEPNGNEATVPFNLLDADFFDDRVMVVVYRLDEARGPASIATVGYSDVIFEPLQLEKYVTDSAREAVAFEVFQRLKDGQLSSVPAPIMQSRTLVGCREGRVSLARAAGGDAEGHTGLVHRSRAHAAGSDDNASHLSEAALRKKKNADAQAAFRARRANYIATLEETVTNLEAVVIQLQDSCREAKIENAELRLEIARMREEGKERDRVWKKMMQGRRQANPNPQSNDFSANPMYSARPSSSVVAPQMNSANMGHHYDNALRYPTGGDQPASMGGTFYHPTQSQDFSQRSPALTFASSMDGDTPPEQQVEAQRMPRYDQYPYPMDNAARDTAWVPPEQTCSPGEMFDSGSSSHSPNYVESPTLTSSELSYPTSFPLDEQKLAFSSLNSPGQYMLPSSRSISPAVSTPTSTSSSTTSLAPGSFPFTFPEGTGVQDRPEFAYRRQLPGPQLTLHGGTANIQVAPPGRDARYRMQGRPNILTDRPMAQALSSYSRTDNDSGGRDSDDSEANSYTYSNRSRPHSEAPSTRVSRSPSPGPPPICGTLAVIKAQAFGALRRTRTRSKKTSEGAAKAAVEALEARGIGMGLAVGNAAKRPRLLADDDNMLS